MKIVELKSSNIKRLKAVELSLDDKQNIVMITGRNGQGKSSILDSIWYALGGGKIVPEKPIRDGEVDAEVKLDLGEYVVTRTFTEKGTYLKVENKDGAKYSNPQKLLDTVIGNLSFDPLEFSRLEPKKQIEQLIALTGLDFTDLDKQKKEKEEERTLVGRELKAMGVIAPETVEAAKVTAAKPEVNITELAKKIQEGQSALDKYQQSRRDIESNNNSIANLEAQKKQIESTITALQQKNAELEKVTAPDVKIAELQASLDTAEKQNADIREAKKILAEDEARGNKQIQYDGFTDELEGIAFTRETRLKEAKMPIDGLAWSETAVTYHGIPFDQLSAAEQLKISMAMAMVANPKLRVILIRDGSLLDNENLKVIQEMAADLDFQVWIERVDDTGKVGIYIEDGEVKEINGQPSKPADAGPSDAGTPSSPQGDAAAPAAE